MTALRMMADSRRYAPRARRSWTPLLAGRRGTVGLPRRPEVSLGHLGSTRVIARTLGVEEVVVCRSMQSGA